MQDIYNILRQNAEFSLLSDLLSREKSFVTVGGLAGSMSSFLAVSLLESTSSLVIVVVSSHAQAERLLDDLATISGSDKVAYLPPVHLHPYDSSPLAMGPKNERIDALLRFAMRKSSILVTQPEAMLEKCPDRAWAEEHTVTISTGKTYPRQKMLQELANAGYQRESLVDAQGYYAIRGGLLDVFPFGFEQPVRIEFDGDEIDSLRMFNPVTQRSVETVRNLVFLLGDEPDEGGGTFIELLPDDAIVFWHGVEEIDERFERFRSRAEKAYANGYTRAGLAPDKLYPSRDYIETQTGRLRQVFRFELIRGKQVTIDFNSVAPESVTPELNLLPEYISGYVRDGMQVWVTTDTEGEKERLAEVFSENDLEAVRTITPMLSSGFVQKKIGLAVLTAQQLFQRRRLRARHTRFRRRAVQFDRSSLRRGDYVVHADYGIGKYEGLQTVKIQEQPRECLRIRYAENIILYIRIEDFSLVEKYTGMESGELTLSRIGTKEWDRVKRKTRKAIKDMAADLVKLYAQRKIIKGYSYPADTHWQREMEASFEFEDTPDQVVTTREIKLDLENVNPMDRLLCGDVGFGKTEVAIRAAFKVVQESRQVAILVPTTILAQQHYQTFRERLAPYPIRIDVLSRFRSSKEQRETIAGLKNGEVDIVIGTHRLLSRDVGFKKLGLLVIDEEHRFGVRQKERVKQLKINVEILTMTATPIPRTLHMALMGARDTSQINTPPADRLPIQTEVYPWSEKIIRDAILRETDRQGQVFFLHNRVQSIYAVRGMLERIAPGLSYSVAHGQMKESTLEKVMFDFMHGRYDVLITTMIIESGLDIPNANTLIVSRADRFGLAQLYQVRGRIGRSNRQAYAYLLTPPRLVMTSEARKRLTTLTELTELGSGMKVAMRDLEIRGAGNILGAQQSGHVNAVGFDLYCRMLEEEVGKAKDSEGHLPSIEEIDVKVDFDGPALFPMEYIDDSDLRYDFYRRLAYATDIDEIARLEDELLDRFGNLPDPARNLMLLSRLKLLGKKAGFSKLTVAGRNLTVILDLPPDPAESQKAIGRLVSRAYPAEIEFRSLDPVSLIHPLKSSKSLQMAENFLRHLTREGIFRD